MKKYYMLVFWGSMITNMASAADLERFFTSQQVREQLNQMREQYKLLAQEDGNIIQCEKPSFQENITFQGLLIRSDGSSEIWLKTGNSQANNKINRTIRSQLKDKDKQIVQLTSPEGVIANLKPGQTYNVGRNQIIDIYQRTHKHKISKIFPDGSDVCFKK